MRRILQLQASLFYSKGYCRHVFEIQIYISFLYFTDSGTHRLEVFGLYVGLTFQPNSMFYTTQGHWLLTNVFPKGMQYMACSVSSDTKAGKRTKQVSVWQMQVQTARVKLISMGAAYVMSYL